jgi:hypothetical protein
VCPRRQPGVGVTEHDGQLAHRAYAPPAASRACSGTRNSA